MHAAGPVRAGVAHGVGMRVHRRHPKTGRPRASPSTSTTTRTHQLRQLPANLESVHRPRIRHQDGRCRPSMLTADGAARDLPAAHGVHLSESRADAAEGTRVVARSPVHGRLVARSTNYSWQGEPAILDDPESVPANRAVAAADAPLQCIGSTYERVALSRIAERRTTRASSFWADVLTPHVPRLHATATRWSTSASA